MPATYLVDSNILIEAMRPRSTASLKDLLSRIAPEGLAVSVIVVGEVMEGILASPQRELNRQRWQDLLAVFDVIDVTREIAEIWAEVRGTLRRAGRTLPDIDLLIASTALRFDMTVVTLNDRHFAPVPGLEVIVPELA